MKPEYMGGKFALIPNIDSMVGNTSAENKQKYLEISQLLLNLVDSETGKPLYNPQKIIEAGRGIIDEVIDIDKLAEKDTINQNPQSIVDELDAGMEGIGQMPQETPGFIPPAQRS